MANEMLKGGLDPACIKVELTASGRDAAIAELIGLIHAKHRLRNPDEAIQAVLERERKMSTSLENGLAIPHGKLASVDRLLVAVGLKQKGIDFKSADGQPSKIIVLILSAAGQSGPHVRCLAEIGRLLQSEAVRRQLLQAQDADTIYRLVTGT